jgi:predicted ATPase/class 3 adenylate cyclase
MSSAGSGGEPPRTTTFLFTDIEGHTELWAGNPDAMAQALAAHEEVIADAVNSRGGRVVKSEGDAVMAVFGDPAAAVGAATAMQLVFVTTDWPGVGVLRVRIGLHAGTAYERGGDYFGPEVIRAARLRDAAHGQQILASRAVASLAPANEWTDLGSYQLRGLDGAEHVYQLSAAGLPTEFPPLRTAESATDRLPHPRTSFVGRVGELALVARELDRHRIVTLTGVGGCGKTRLAIESARAAIEDFPDGAEFVDLAPVTDEASVYPALAAALALSAAQGSTEPISTRVHSYLARRRAVVVIDNCEHLLDAVAELVDELLAKCEHVRVLATSREPLRVEDERIVQVGSLELGADAVALFHERSETRDGDADTILRICQRLDGLPLAIELAAARTTHLSVDDIADRLDDRFHLLTGGRRRVQRQQTMEATLDWSHDLLTPDERALLRRLAVFSGSFRLQAVEGVCAGDFDDATRVLGALVERSMVVYNGGERRYRMLETVRLYAERKLLDAGETAQYRHRHRDWFRAYVCALPFEECFFYCATSRGLVADVDDLRTAVRWSIDNDDTETAAEIAIRLATATVLIDSPDVVIWAGQLVPRLPPDSDVAFHLFLAAYWCGTAIGWRDARRGSPLDAQTVGVAALEDIVSRLRGLAEARTDEVSIFVRAYIAPTLDAIARLRGDDDAARDARRLRDNAVEMARAAPLSVWTGQALGFAGLFAMARNEADEAAAFLREARSAGELVRSLIDPLLAVALHVLGDSEAYEFALRSQVVPMLPYLVNSATAAALELAVRGDQIAARAQLRLVLSDSARSVQASKSNLLIAAAGVALHGGDYGRAGRWLASAAGVGGLFTTPAGFMLYERYVPSVRAALPRDERQRVREQGRALSLDDAFGEVTNWLSNDSMTGEASV